MILNTLLLGTNRSGYIAGNGDGIVTVAGQPAQRDIWLFNAQTLAVEQIISSLKNGHYIFRNLDVAKRYLVMVRDFKPSGSDQRYEPFVWDYISPSDDLTIDEQKALWQSWQ